MIGINSDTTATGPPPDPVVAVGQHHVVTAVNEYIQSFEKRGSSAPVSEGLTSLGVTSGTDFFETFTPEENIADPKVLYDQYANRFVLIILEVEAVSPRILMAVSNIDNTVGDWHLSANWALRRIDLNTTTHGVADFPGLAVDQENIYITANMFNTDLATFRNAALFTVAKTAFNAGMPQSVAFDFDTLTGFTSQPAHMFGAEPQAGFGTFLVRTIVNYSGTTDAVAIRPVTNPSAGNSTLGTEQFVTVGNINTAFVMTDAPQTGTSTRVETNDARALQAVWRDNELWATSTVVPPSGADAGETTAHWYRFNTATVTAVTLAEQQDIGADGVVTDAYTFYPSLAVDGFGNVAVGFGMSASTIRPSAYYAVYLRDPSTGLSVLQGIRELKAGEGPYDDTRWGDYSGMALDPGDLSSMWVFNEYSLPKVGSASRWGTYLGRFRMPVSLRNFNDTTDTIGAGDVHAAVSTQGQNLSDELVFLNTNTTAGQRAVLAVNPTTYVAPNAPFPEIFEVRGEYRHPTGGFAGSGFTDAGDRQLLGDVSGDGVAELIQFNFPGGATANGIRLVSPIDGTPVIVPGGPFADDGIDANDGILNYNETSPSGGTYHANLDGLRDSDDRVFVGHFTQTAHLEALFFNRTNQNTGAISLRALDLVTGAITVTYRHCSDPGPTCGGGIYAGWVDSTDENLISDQNSDSYDDLVFVNRVANPAPLRSSTTGFIGVVSICTLGVQTGCMAVDPNPADEYRGFYRFYSWIDSFQVFDGYDEIGDKGTGGFAYNNGAKREVILLVNAVTPTNEYYKVLDRVDGTTKDDFSAIATVFRSDYPQFASSFESDDEFLMANIFIDPKVPNESTDATRRSDEVISYSRSSGETILRVFSPLGNDGFGGQGPFLIDGALVGRFPESGVNGTAGWSATRERTFHEAIDGIFVRETAFAILGDEESDEVAVAGAVIRMADEGGAR